MSGRSTLLSDLIVAEPEARYKRLIQQQPEPERAALYAEMHRLRYEHIFYVRMRWADTLHEGFGQGHDERVVEIPLAFETVQLNQPGLILDAGAALAPALTMIGKRRWPSRIIHYSQAADAQPVVSSNRRSYLYGDLRNLEFKDDVFDRIACVSTYEHIGMDNGRYGGARETDPASALAAWDHLLRVLKPDGNLLLTVPYGQPAEHDWFRVIGPDEISQLIAAAVEAGFSISPRYFVYCRGWVDCGPQPMPSDPDEPISGLAVLRI